MTPASLLKFLNAARNLAKQGFKQEDIIKFAKQEFGEVTDLVKLQINKIFKTKNQPTIGKKDPVFDNTVETIPFDDTGTPFNPKDPQKVYGKPREGIETLDEADKDIADIQNTIDDLNKTEAEADVFSESIGFPTATKKIKIDNMDVNKEIKKGVDDIMSDTSPAALEKSIEVDNLMLEYPGMSRELAKQIANDPDPARKAQVISMVEQTIKMGDEGMSGDEIIDIFKKGTDRTKQAKGGRIKMAKGGLPNILGF
jgi:hypothetical protein